VEYAARFVPANRHRHLLPHARLHQVPNCATAEVVHDQTSIAWVTLACNLCQRPKTTRDTSPMPFLAKVRSVEHLPGPLFALLKHPDERVRQWHGSRVRVLSLFALKADKPTCQVNLLPRDLKGLADSNPA